MKTLEPILRVVVPMLLLTACSTVKVAERDEYEGPKLPHPPRIVVYDFAATPGDLPDWAAGGSAQGLPQATADHDDIAAARKLGADISKELVKKLDAMGMTSVRAENQPPPQLNDLAIVGYFTSIEAGSGMKRVVVGFGKGAARVNAHVEGYRDTTDSMQRLGSGTVDSGGSGKSPGLVVPALVTVATHNPIGLVVSGAAKAEAEVSGRTTDEGSAERLADEIAKALEPKFREQGWI